MATTVTANGPEYLVEEKIWGHRLYNEQSGPMVVLEFFNVLQFLSFQKFDSLLRDSGKLNCRHRQPLSYESYRRMTLRTLLFNNPYIEYIDQTCEQPWKKWEEYFAEPDSPYSDDLQNRQDKTQASTNHRLLNNWRKEGSWNSAYLRKAFGNGVDHDNWDSFKNFADILKLIRSCSFNVSSNKRWTSLFVFPWGKDCIFAETDEHGSPDKRFFGRSGELLYILLSYADHRNELEDLIKQLYFDTQHPLNRICKVLQGEPTSSHEFNEVRLSNQGAFGPEKETKGLYRRANLLCDDLIALLKSRLPSEDLFAHLSRIIGLHLLCYFFERAKEATNPEFYCESCDPLELKNDQNYSFFCEILATKMNSIRHASQTNYRENQNLSTAAIKFYIDSNFASLIKEAQESSQDDDLDMCLVRVKEQFYSRFSIRQTKRSDYENITSSEELKKVFVDKVRRRHEQHWGKVAHEYGKAIGLASRSGTNRYRYCPNDELIISLMLANVESDRILLNEFLQKLYDKYHIIIGFPGSKEFNLRLNESDINQNVERFKTRLKSLGLLETLSDGYDFVQNSFFVRS